jgi:hypothetical protein
MILNLILNRNLAFFVKVFVCFFKFFVYLRIKGLNWLIGVKNNIDLFIHLLFVLIHTIIRINEGLSEKN